MVAVLVSFPQDMPAADLDKNSPTVLITGSNRGLGLEFARQYADKGWNVIATCRDPDGATELSKLQAANAKVVIEQLDVNDYGAIDSLASSYADTPIDVLINNAAIGGGSRNQIVGELKYDVFKDVLLTNTISPLKMAEAFLPHVEASKQKKIIAVSSSQGSIAQVRQPRLYFYRSSKSALNMVMRNLALDLAPRGVIVGLVTPGATDTDFMKGVRIPLRDPKVATADMIRLIDGFSLDNSGSFYHYDGTPLPW